MKKIVRLAIALFVLMAVVTGFIYANIVFFADHSQPVKSDVILVLGCKVNGETPSLLLEYRLDKALELYQLGYGSGIIVSGGQGSNEAVTESAAMKTWLVRHKVPENIIIEENRATSTFENIKFSKAIMEKKNFRTAVIVSNDFHIFRSLLLAKRLGLECSAAPAPDVAYNRLYYRAREVLSVVKSFVFDR